MEFRIPSDDELRSLLRNCDRVRTRLASADGPEEMRDDLRVILESTASSCRMAGLRFSDDAVEAILNDPQPLPDHRELTGYANALRWQGIVRSGLLTPHTLRLLHAVMMGDHPERPEASALRSMSAYREAFDENGVAMGRIFNTLPPRLIKPKLDALLSWYELELRTRRHHPVLIVGTLVLGVLAASPFERGNGRFARLLLARLLERAGYRQVRHASLDRVIEESRDAHYDHFDSSVTQFWTGDADLRPWLHYVLLALQELGRRTGGVRPRPAVGAPKSDLQRRILAVMAQHDSVNAGMLLRATGANRNTLKDNMRRLVDAGTIVKIGERRATRYRLPEGDA